VEILQIIVRPPSFEFGVHNLVRVPALSALMNAWQVLKK
jgi:hypothetical protein